MDYSSQYVFIISIVFYVMVLMSGINYIVTIRRFQKKFNQCFKGREDDELSDDEAEKWQEYHRKTVATSLTFFIVFVILSAVFSIGLIVMNI